MFKQITEKFGRLEKITIHNDDVSFSVIPGYGANVNSIHLFFEGKSHPVIDGVKTYDELIQDKTFRSSVLLPWPNRLKDGKYAFEGNVYQAEINEVDRNTALHGFIYRKKFDVEDIILLESAAEIRLSCRYEGEEAGYPFKFQANLSYAISATDGFTVKVEIINTDSGNIPMGFGWHPYIKLPSKINDIELQIPQTLMYAVDERLIPTGKTADFQKFALPAKIGESSFDGCFRIIDPDVVVSTLVLDKAAGLLLKFWQETGANGFNYLQVYTPLTRDTIALEPMTCGVDAFNNKDGLLVMRPGERFTGRFGLNLVK